MVSLRRGLHEESAPLSPGAAALRLLDGRPGEFPAAAGRAPPAVGVAIAFGVGASLLRMAFGGHFLSDALLGGLITLIVIVLARRVIWPQRRALKGCAPRPRAYSRAAIRPSPLEFFL